MKKIKNNLVVKKIKNNVIVYHGLYKDLYIGSNAYADLHKQVRWCPLADDAKRFESWIDAESHAILLGLRKYEIVKIRL